MHGILVHRSNPLTLQFTAILVQRLGVLEYVAASGHILPPLPIGPQVRT